VLTLPANQACGKTGESWLDGQNRHGCRRGRR
jgi:hypothetical protein